jgi:hypothetical protein
LGTLSNPHGAGIRRFGRLAPRSSSGFSG